MMVFIIITYVGVRKKTATSQQGESEEIPKACCRWGGHVVRVKAKTFESKDKSHHNDTWRDIKHTAQQFSGVSQIKCCKCVNKKLFAKEDETSQHGPFVV